MVRVPASLLLASELTAAAKLLWMVFQLHPGSTVTYLADRSGLSRPTVRKGIAQLQAAGWATEVPCEETNGANMPPELLADTRQEAHTRLIYGFLQLTPGFANPRGRFRIAELAALMGVTPTTVKRALKQLHSFGWVRLAQRHKLAPLGFALLNPAESKRQTEVEEARRRVNEAQWEGQALMREWLSLTVDSDLYQDDAKPALLKNPYTDENLEFDRYYPPAVAFEFQGPQHYGPTARFPDQEAAWKQEARDYMKAGICATRGIHLRRVHRADLTLEGMLRQVGNLLPLRDLTGHEPLIAYLEAASDSYRRRSAR